MKNLLYAVLFLLLSNTVQAQFENMRLGASFDVLPISWMHSDQTTIERAGVNYSFGVDLRVEYHMTPHFSLTSGVGMQFNQGGTLSYEEGGNVFVDADLSEPELYSLPAGSEVSYNIRYLEIPVALKMRTNEFGRFRIFCEIPRLELGITTNGRAKIVIGNTIYEREVITKSLSWLNVSYGLTLGTEYSLSKNISAFGGITYKQGIFDITEDKGLESKDQTGLIALVVGVLF